MWIHNKPVLDPVWADDFFTDRALDWLKEERGDRPFCLLLWQQSPHAPFFRARRHANLYNGVPIPVPSTFNDDVKGYPGKPRAFAEAFNKIGIIETGDAVRSLEERSMPRANRPMFLYWWDGTPMSTGPRSSSET